MRQGQYTFANRAFAALLLFVIAQCGLAGTPAPADTIFFNGVIYTADKAHAIAQAVAIRDDKIVFVGNDSRAQSYIGPKTIQINLKSRLLMPAFTDAHAHLDQGGIQALYEISFTDVINATLKDYLRQIGDFAKAFPGLRGYRGMGWVNGVAPGIGPLASDLDRIIPAKPVVLRSQDGHSVWINSKALELAHITKSTKDPQNGKIERLPNGIPAGTLREEAMSLVNNVIPAYTQQQYEDAIVYFQKTVAGPLGITQIFVPGLPLGGPQMAAFASLARSGKLSMRIRTAAVISPEEPLAQQIQAAASERAKYANPLFQVSSAKFFVDGVIEGHTGYLLHPYTDAAKYNGQPGYRGMPMWPSAALNSASTAAAKAGFGLHYHAIGDAAVRMALDAIAAAQNAAGNPAIPPSITHLQLVAPEDILRFEKLGTIAVVQPYWFVIDKYYFWNIQVPYLGKLRADREYPMHSFLKNGVLVASSSDYPVTLPPNPLIGIETGVLRWYQEGSSGKEVLWPRERCTLEQMMDSFTINGAKSMSLDNISGSIEAGKSADFVILNRDILRTPPKMIGDPHQTFVLATYFRGRKIFSRTKQDLQ